VTSGIRILVLIPHPDDEVVGCAAAIRRALGAGAAVFGIYLTTGVPPRAKAWPWRRPLYGWWVDRRRKEAQAVATRLGLLPVDWSLRPARTLKDDLSGARAAVATAIRRHEITQLWTPAYEGGHQDHDVANYLASTFAREIAVEEFAEYNFAGGRLRAQEFPHRTGDERVIALDAAERRDKTTLLALYRSEDRNGRNRGRLAFAREMLRPLPAYDYTRAPHCGRLFWERLHWVPFQHPRVDFTKAAEMRAAIGKAAGGFELGDRVRLPG
jgi:N-acetylglucosamine malate deacetylase 1